MLSNNDDVTKSALFTIALYSLLISFLVNASTLYNNFVYL